MEDYAGAIPDLEFVVAKDPKVDYHRAAGLLADAHARERAAYYFALALQYSNLPETMYNYANFLRRLGQADEAREWTRKLAATKRTLPRYMQRVERPWFRKGKAREKQLAG